MCSIACRYHKDTCTSYRFDPTMPVACEIGAVADNVTVIEGGITIRADTSGFETSTSKCLNVIKASTKYCCLLPGFFLASFSTSSSTGESLFQNDTIDFDLPTMPAQAVDKWKEVVAWKGGFLSCFGVIIATNMPSTDCYYAALGSLEWTQVASSQRGHSFGGQIVLEDGRLWAAGGINGEHTGL